MFDKAWTLLGLSSPRQRTSSPRANGGHYLRYSRRHNGLISTSSRPHRTYGAVRDSASEAARPCAMRSSSLSEQPPQPNPRLVVSAVPSENPLKASDVQEVEQSGSDDGDGGVSLPMMEKKIWSAENIEHILKCNIKLNRKLRLAKKELGESQGQLEQQQEQLAVAFTHEVSILRSNASFLEQQLFNQQSESTNESSAQRNEIMKLTHRLRTRDQDFMRVQTELNAEKHNAGVKDNHHQSEVEVIQGQLRRTIDEKKIIEAALEDCKDRLFDMQPYQSLTDDAISRLYTSFCEAVERLVLSELPTESGTLKTLRRSNSGAELVARHMADSEILFSKQFPKIDGLPLVAMVFRYVHSTVLSSQIMVVGLGEVDQGVLGAVMDGLGKLMPPKDARAIDAYRIDMHRALAASTTVQKAQERLVRELTTRCVGCMQSVLTQPDAEPVDEGACHKFVQSAVNLAHEIRLSSTSYRYKHDVEQQEPRNESEYIMHKAEMENFIVINADTGSKIRASTKVEADAEGRVGVKLCSVFPSLVRVGKGEDRNLVLVKGTIVVKFDRGVGMKGKKTQKNAVQPPSLLDEPIREVTGTDAFL